MIINSKKIIFIHIPKTAGSSITMSLKKYTDDNIRQVSEKDFLVTNEKFRLFGETYNYKHATGIELESLYPNKFKAYYKFSVVRNTYERLISLLFWANGAFDRDLLISRIIANTNCNKSHSRPWWPATRYLCDKQGRLMVNEIVHFTHLERFFNKLCRKYKLDAQLKRLNVTHHSNYVNYYDPELRYIVSQYYEQEIKFFNFKFGASP